MTEMISDHVKNSHHLTGSKSYTMKCAVEDMGIFYIGEGRDAKIFERFCNYEVNGVPGWGISEWDYRYFLHPTSKKKSVA